MNFWWCNQKNDWRQESAHSLIISNKSKRDHYRRTVKNAKKGDIVFHYNSAKKSIFAISLVLEDGTSFNEQIELEANGKRIERGPGWKFRTEYFFLEPGISVDEKMKKALWEKDRGLIYPGNKQIFQGYFKNINIDAASILLHLIISANEIPQWFLDSDVILELAERSINQISVETEVERIVKMRVGQARFRNDLLKESAQCMVTGIVEPALLRASHIKPWYACEETEKRDPQNGLLLCAHLDLAFDQGLISFDEQGEVLVSTKLSEKTNHILGLKEGLRLKSELTKFRKRYLEYHRKWVFHK